MSTGHGKNFLAGSLVDQHYYFDELEERVQFPAMFPAALLCVHCWKKPNRITMLLKPIRLCLPVTLFPWTGGCCNR
jgi:hypothetical protein